MKQDSTQIQEPEKKQIMPLPWIAIYGERLSDGGECRVIDSENGSVAEMMCPKDVEDVTAEFIVRAVNNHEALVEALKQVRAAFFVDAQAGAYVEKGKLIPLDNEQHPWIPGASAPEVIAMIDAALAAAKE